MKQLQWGQFDLLLWLPLPQGGLRHLWGPRLQKVPCCLSRLCCQKALWLRAPLDPSLMKQLQLAPSVLKAPRLSKQLLWGPSCPWRQANQCQEGLSHLSALHYHLYLPGQWVLAYLRLIELPQIHNRTCSSFT